MPVNGRSVIVPIGVWQRGETGQSTTNLNPTGNASPKLRF